MHHASTTFPMQVQQTYPTIKLTVNLTKLPTPKIYYLIDKKGTEQLPCTNPAVAVSAKAEIYTILYLTDQDMFTKYPT